MKLFIVFILLNFVFFDVSSAQVKASSQSSLPEWPVWTIENSRVRGTGFFIEPNRFITSFRVISGLLNNQDTRLSFLPKNILKNTTLSQEGNPSIVLRVKRVRILSSHYDLALVETKEKAPSHLSTRDNPLKPSEGFFIPDYSEGVFKKNKKNRKYYSSK